MFKTNHGIIKTHYGKIFASNNIGKQQTLKENPWFKNFRTEKWISNLYTFLPWRDYHKFITALMVGCTDKIWSFCGNIWNPIFEFLYFHGRQKHSTASCPNSAWFCPSGLNTAWSSGSSPEGALFCHKNHTDNLKTIIL